MIPSAGTIKIIRQRPAAGILIKKVRQRLNCIERLKKRREIIDRLLEKYQSYGTAD